MKSLPQLRSLAGPLAALAFLVFLTPLASAQPDHLWARSFGGTHPDRINDLTYDTDGNLYATGLIQGAVVLSDNGDTLHLGAVGNHEIILNKYSPTGTLLWSRVWAAPGADEGRAVSTDADGNVYLTGTFTGLINFGTSEAPIILETIGWGSTAFLLKANAAGEVQWARALGGEFTSTGSGVAVTPDGHVAMCGRFLDSLIVTPTLPNFIPQAGADGNRVFLIKFSNNGDFMWLKRFGGAAGMPPKGLKADADGSLVLAGDYIGTLVLNPGNPAATFTSQGSDLYVAKYDSLGDYQWARSIGGTSWEFVQDLALSSTGDIAITGSFMGTLAFGQTPGQHVVTSVNDADVYVARLSANGTTLWAHSAGSSGADQGLGVVIDDFDQVHIGGVFRQVMGFSNGDATYNIEAAGIFALDAFMATYAPDGSLQWAASLGCPYSAYVQTLASKGEKLAAGGRFGGDLFTNFQSSTATVSSQFNGTSEDAFVAAYVVKDESAGTCTANGGTLQAPANRSFCVGTGQPSGINLTAVGASGSLQRWVLADPLGNIVASRTTNSLFNLDSYPPGDYTIHYIRFEADVTNLGSITHVSQIGTLNGCYAIASNAIIVFLRSAPSGGVLSANGPTQICIGQGAQSVSVSVTGNSGPNNLYALVSTPGQTLVASNTTGQFNLNGFPTGNYAVAHLSYHQGVSLAGVTTPSQLQGCYALSNNIPVTISTCGSADLSAYPNPTSAVSHITFSTPRSGYATLEVYDMSGRWIASLYAGEMKAGEVYLRDFQGDGLPHGVYFLRLTSPDEVAVHKLLLAH